MKPRSWALVFAVLSGACQGSVTDGSAPSGAPNHDPNRDDFERPDGALVEPGNDAGTSNDAGWTPIEPGEPIDLPVAGQWTNVTSNIAGLASECGNLGILSAVPGTGKIIAGIARRGLYVTSNGGGSWSALGTGAGSATVDNRPSTIVYDPTDSNTFWVSGIYGNGVYKTTNGGNTFERLGDISHDDSVSVDFTDPSRKTLLAGGHEQSQTVHKSTNGGQTWTNVGANLPGGTNFSTNPFALDSQTYLVNAGASWGSGSTGIFRTTNGGTSWQQVSGLGPVKSPLRAFDGTIVWAAGNGVARSTDEGLTWTQVGSGLRNEINPIQLPDGKLVSVGQNTLMASDDGGATWTGFGANLPFSSVAGVVYSAAQNAFFSWTWDCGNAVLPNAVARLQ